MADQPVHQNLNITIPDSAVAGLYADFVSVWHTPNIFVMDFAAIAQPPTTATNTDTGMVEITIPGQIIQRVRIPPEQVFELAKALTQQLEAWEQESGRRTPFDPTAQ